MSDEETALGRVMSAISPFSTIDRRAHAERIVDVIEKLGTAPPQLAEELLARAQESSPYVPEQEVRS